MRLHIRKQLSASRGAAMGRLDRPFSMREIVLTAVVSCCLQARWFGYLKRRHSTPSSLSAVASQPMTSPIRCVRGFASVAARLYEKRPIKPAWLALTHAVTFSLAVQSAFGKPDIVVNSILGGLFA
jgi:hypothetical protein